MAPVRHPPKNVWCLLVHTHNEYSVKTGNALSAALYSSPETLSLSNYRLGYYWLIIRFHSNREHP